MTDTPTATALAQAATEIRAAARTHKRAEAMHRRQARALMRTLADLQAVCDELGIQLVVEDPRGGRHG